MNEKIYKTMGRIGGGNIAMGVVLVVVGIVTGVLMIVSVHRYSSADLWHTVFSHPQTPGSP